MDPAQVPIEDSNTSQFHEADGNESQEVEESLEAWRNSGAFSSQVTFRQVSVSGAKRILKARSLAREAQESVADRTSTHNAIQLLQSAHSQALASSTNNDIYEESLTSSRRIRLVHIVPLNEPTTRDIPMLQLIMVTVSLIESVDYDALSYCWGDQQDRRQILVNNQPCSITSGLQDALLSFRETRTASLWLWVDAICINQQNTLERNHQVTLMADIFRSASRVHVWLGLGVPGTPQLFRFIQAQIALNCPEAVVGPQLCRKDLNVEESDDQERSLSEILSALGQCAWWYRLWTLQEVALATHPMVHWGNSALPFTSLVTALADLDSPHIVGVAWDEWHANPRQSAIHIDAYAERMLKFASGYCAAIYYAGRIDSWGRFAELFEGTAERDTTLPHDMVYAVLGLLPEVDICPNYHSAPGEVYADFTYHMLLRYGSPRLLFLSGGPDDGQHWPFSSWVFNFGSAKILWPESPGKGDSRNALGRFEIQHVRPGVLQIRARMIDTVVSCSALLPRFEHIRTVKQLLMNERSLDDLKTMLSVLLRYAGSQCSQFTSCRCIFGNILEATALNTMTVLLDWVIHDLGKTQLHQIRDVDLLELLRRLGDNRCFLTAGGCIGIGKAFLRPGDSVAVFAGDDGVFILGPTASDNVREHRLIGGCYCYDAQGDSLGSTIRERESERDDIDDFFDYVVLV